MSSWTSADLKRLDSLASMVWLCATNTAMLNARWDVVDSRAQSLVEKGPELMRAELARTAGPDTRESRAAARLAERLSAESIPASVQLPWARHLRPPAPEPAVVQPPAPAKPTHAEIIEANARVQQALAPAKVALEIGRVLERGEASVHGAPGDAFGLPIDWSDVEGRVSWHAWLAPVAVELGCPAPTWAALESTSSWSERARAGVLHIWREALSRGAPLPSVLDLRGLPTAHGLLLERYQAPLKNALAQAERGIVLLVDTNAWALARCLA